MPDTAESVIYYHHPCICFCAVCGPFNTLFCYFQAATRPAAPAKAHMDTRRRERRPPRPLPPLPPPSTSTTRRSIPPRRRPQPRSPTWMTTTTTRTHIRSPCSRTSRSTSRMRIPRSLIPEVSSQSLNICSFNKPKSYTR